MNMLHFKQNCIEHPGSLIGMLQGFLTREHPTNSCAKSSSREETSCWPTSPLLPVSEFLFLLPSPPRGVPCLFDCPVSTHSADFP